MKKILIRLILPVLALLAGLGILELFFIGYFWVQDGGYVSVSTKLLGEHNAYVETYDPKTGFYRKTDGAGAYFPHPFVGYARHSIPPTGLPAVNHQGLSREPVPDEKDPEVFTIMITGGSVAAGLAGHTPPANLMEQRLNQGYVLDGHSRFRVLNGACGSWKQPHQLIHFMLFAGSVDAVISVEGFNEFREIWVRPEFAMRDPAGNYYGALRRILGNPNQFFQADVERRMRDLMFTHPVVRRSKLCYFVLSRLREALKTAFSSDGNPVDGAVLKFSRGMFRLPEDWSAERKRAHKINDYKRFLRQMNAVAKAENVRPLIVIQPTSFYGKTLTPREQQVIQGLPSDFFDTDLYLKMTEELTGLRAEGVPVFSFLDIYGDLDGQEIFGDTVHLNHRGNSIVIDKLLELMEREWGLQKLSGPVPAGSPGRIDRI